MTLSSSTPTIDPGRIGSLLIREGLLNSVTLEQLIVQQGSSFDPDLVGELLVEKGLISQSTLLDILKAELTREREAYAAGTTTPKAAIRFQGVHKTLDGRKVLDGIDLEIPEGMITALIGVSGGGKSVTLKHMIGLMRPEQGDILVGGQPVNRLSGRALNAVRQRFGMLFQGGALFDSMDVFANVAFPLREKRELPEVEIGKRVKKSLEEVNLGSMGAKFPDELSGGMMKRAALARALVTRPEIILLDEPTAGLDPIIEHSIHHLICDTFIRSRYTMVIISHAVPEIFNWCHHAVVLHQGRILESGPSLKIRHSEHPVIRQFIHGSLEGPIKVM
ncbi:MAG: ATP-binding cassette domain-containing protein [Magnetococcales bacterium]|nr:ATP-binding cassette domain-containing protein [Magnetococcales bacterium]